MALEFRREEWNINSFAHSQGPGRRGALGGLPLSKSLFWSNDECLQLGTGLGDADHPRDEVPSRRLQLS